MVNHSKSINGESEVFALSQSLGRTTKDNGFDELGDTAMEGVQVCSSVGGHGWGELIGPWVGRS